MSEYVEQIQPRRVRAEIVADDTKAKNALRIDNVTTTNVTYVGKAALGASTSDSVWQIQKIDESQTPETTIITWADSNDKYDNVWDNRASLTYV